jgi:integrase
MGGELPRQRYQEPKLEQTQRGVWFFRPRVDKIGEDGSPKRLRETITIGAMGKREAVIKMREIMKTINNSDYVIKSQIPVSELLDRWDALHVNRLKASTQDKYKTHLKNHVRPAFGEIMLCEFGDSLKLQTWIDAKKLSWHTKTDLRNILSSIFTKAIEWKIWTESNPVEHVHVGRKTVVYERRKLTDDEMRRFLAELPYDVRIACAVALFCTLRVSEVLALQEKHIDFVNGLILVRQRYYRGDLDTTKNLSAERDVAIGYLTSDLKRLSLGNPERFIFQIETHPMYGRKTALCRDDRALLQHFLRPAAKRVGCYFKGFGWHSLRREAITANNATLDPMQSMRMSGHSSPAMSGHYTLADREAQDRVVRARQEKLLGSAPEGKAN